LVIAYVIFERKIVASKDIFKDRNKIQRLLIEQKLLLDNIPDGAIIYSINDEQNQTLSKENPSDLISTSRKLDETVNINIKYTNSTFKKMFDNVI